MHGEKFHFCHDHIYRSTFSFLPIGGGGVIITHHGTSNQLPGDKPYDQAQQSINGAVGQQAKNSQEQQSLSNDGTGQQKPTSQPQVQNTIATFD